MIQTEKEIGAAVAEAKHQRKALLRAEGIEKVFVNGSVRTSALRGVDLTVYEGEFLVILGPSGCGKSTLLHILGGMERPTGGVLWYRTKNLCTCTEKELVEYRRSDIGFVFQNYNLMPNLNVIKNLRLIGELVDQSADAGRVLHSVGLSDKKNRFPCQLSGGEQQRVSIARALMKNPKILVADEPTAALDYTSSVEVLTVFEKIHRQGTTIIMVTHNEQIAKMADRVARMRDGKITEVTENTHPTAAKGLVW